MVAASSPEAWSLRPARFAFDINAPQGNRLRIMLGLSRAGPICVLYEISEEAPGQAIPLHTPATLPPGRERLSLSATPQGHGTRATITGSSLVARLRSKADTKGIEEAVTAFQDAAARFRETGDRHGQGWALDDLDEDLYEVGRLTANEDGRPKCADA